MSVRYGAGPVHAPRASTVVYRHVFLFEASIFPNAYGQEGTVQGTMYYD